MAATFKACGFVLVRETAGGAFEYLILVNRKRGDAGLPKGHVEPGEDETATARRETEEETGLVDLAIDPWFRRDLVYPVAGRRGAGLKTVVYFLARARSGDVRLSDEHSHHEWLPVGAAMEVLPFGTLKSVVADAALFLKDASLFRLAPRSEADARAHLAALPHADEALLGHLDGGARIARALATALAARGVPLHVEAAAAGTLLHDVGRALGEHADHQRAGVRHLHATPFAPYAFACISHFTKGASPGELHAAGVAPDIVADFCRTIDGSTLTWEEHCAALADACMKGTQPVPPAERFADLRRRYDAPALIDLQERRTAAIRAAMAEVLGRDPLFDVGLGS